MTLAPNEQLVAGAQRPRLQRLPADVVTSAAVEAEKLANECGLFLDDWQSWCLHHLLGERADGSFAAQTVALLVPRQNGKNAVLEALELAAIYLFGEEMVIHSAHRHDTASDHMARMRSLVTAHPELDAITRFYDTNGKERMVRTDTGQTIRFMTRGKKTVRGGSPQRVVFDEALYLSDEQIQAILPSLSAQSMRAEGAPQTIYTSSAPLPDSTVLHRVRRNALSGRSDRVFYAEWGCEVGVDIEDRAAWYAANPGIGVRISEQWVTDNELAILSPDAFAVERLGVVFPETGEAPQSDPKLLAEEWAHTMTDVPPEVAPGRVALAFEVAHGGEWCSVGVAAGDIRRPYVELIEHRKGTGWLPGRLVELVERWDPTSVGCIGAGPSGAQVGAVVSAFREAGISADLVDQMTMTRYRAACEGFYLDVAEGRLTRPAGQGPLDLAATDAASAAYGDAWAWAQRDASIPITPLVAVTVARALLPVETDSAPPALTQIF